MREEYDFSDAKRENPYIDRIRLHGYALVVNCGAAQSSLNDTDNDVPYDDSVAEHESEYKKATKNNTADGSIVKL